MDVRDDKEKEGIEGFTFVVTGALGFVGSALCTDLIRRGAKEVRALDIWSDDHICLINNKNGINFIHGDVSNKKDVERALSGADCVFHLASYGMSGKEMLQVGRVETVNMNGTCHVLDACLEFGIKRHVYVSTYSVVFGGKEIMNGNEALPYIPIHEHVDPYGRSKSVAEQLVLKNNGHLSKKNGTRLYSCVVRPAEIYGPGEETHLPRIVSLAKMGLFTFKIGAPSVKTDWVYLDNLVLALILASRGLLDDIPGKEGHPVAAGQPYFISDGSPVNTFEFFRPLLRSLDYDLPKAALEVPHAFFVARFFEVVYMLLYPLLNRSWFPQPPILPTDVYKVGVTHYFSILKAKEELGYVPMVSPQEGMSATISYWQERKRRSLDGPTIYAWSFSVIGMIALFCASYLPDIGPVKLMRSICLFLFRSRSAVHMVFLFVTICHVGEAIIAWYLAKRVDPKNSKGWFWQTVVLGILSLRFLLKRAWNKYYS